MTTEVIRAVCSATKWGTLTAAEQARYDDTYYTTLALWETAFGDAGVAGDGDLVTADHIAVAEIFEGETNVVDYLDFSADWIMNSLNYCLIRAAKRNEFNSVTKIGAEITSNGVVDYFFVMRADNILYIENIGVIGVEASNNFTYFNTNTSLYFNNCVFDNVVNYVCNSTGNFYAYNCLFIVSEVAVENGPSPYGQQLKNCTIIQPLGLGSWDGQVAIHSCDCYNTVVYNENTKVTSDTTYNVTGDYIAQNNNGSALPPGSNSFGGVIPSDFVDYVNGDYHLSTTSKLTGKGKDLSSEFSTDIDGNAIFNWSIGFDDGPRLNTGRGRFVPGKGYIKGFVTDTVPVIGFTTSRAPIINPDARPIIGFGYTESTAETQLIGSGYSLIEVTVVKYAIRTQAGWDSMTAGEQAEYRGWFDLLSDWEAIIPDDLVVLNEQWVAECYNDFGIGLVDPTVIVSRTTDTTRNIVITIANGEGHSGVIGIGFNLKATGSFEKSLDINCEWVEVYGFSVESTGTSGDGIDAVANCIINSMIANNCNRYGILSGNSMITSNSLVSNAGTAGFYIANWSSPTLYNNTAVDCINGFLKSAATGTDHIVKNNVAYNNTTDFDLDAGSGVEYNASKDTTATTLDPTNSIAGLVAADFTNPAIDDYSVATGSVLIDAGIDLSLEFTTDIVGTERG